MGLRGLDFSLSACCSIIISLLNVIIASKHIHIITNINSHPIHPASGFQSPH